MKLKSIKKCLSKVLKTTITTAPLMLWSWLDTPVDLLVLLERKKLYREGVKKHNNPDYIELLFYQEGIDGPEDIYGCCIDSNLVGTKITDEDVDSWEFKFPKKGFSIVVNWNA